MTARASMLAFAASVALLQTTASFSAQTVSGPLYEDTAACTGGINYCDANFSTYPDYPGKYIRLNLITCNITSPYTLNRIIVFNTGGSISSRTQYVTAPDKTGDFTFGQQIDFVVAALPTRRPMIRLLNTGGNATGNTVNGTCTVSGLIFTP